MADGRPSISRAVTGADDAGPGPRLSVAMCTYNGARYLAAQLGSIAAQTISPFELVVQDDGSSDSTAAIIEAFAATAPFPVRFHRNPERLGPFANFSSCMLRCEGDVVVLSDQDDLWVADRLERTRRAFAADPTLTFTFSDAPLIDEDGQSLGRTIFKTVPVTRADRRALARGTDLTATILRYGVLYGATMAARADLLRQVLPAPAGWSHDEWISLTLSVLGGSLRLDPVIWYRQHAAQSVGAGAAGLAAVATAARARDERFYDVELERYRASIERSCIEQQWATRLSPLIQRKLRFLSTRSSIRRNGLGPRLFTRLIMSSRDYHEFGAGLRSMLKDFALAVASTRREFKG